MKIFSWMRNKLTGKENSDKPIQEPISHHSNEEFSDWPNGLFSIGTFGNNSNSDKTTQAFVEVDNNNLHEDEKRIDENKDTLLQQQTTSLVYIEEKDIKSNNKNKNGIGKRSLSFLLKKALVCSGGFVTGPELRDPVPDPKLDNSRLEKILRAMLHKKIYPDQKASSKKYLDMHGSDSDNDEDEKASNESKWVKTDSEYIVLEI